ncbi:unnamed protein product [Pseudo-nitzschia multistriata]|uniref:Uncharacterized protein n=1 Tax=Pseudo-nitzschia multistriata TaxID=183589 RepID=A0A448ZGF6_9STRA|nr:unnamed protein product [Pseudo-nitzschia multistriata]
MNSSAFNDDDSEVSSITFVSHHRDNYAIVEARTTENAIHVPPNQCDSKKSHEERPKPQPSRNNKAISFMNMATTNVDWSGFSGAAHKSIVTMSLHRSQERPSQQSVLVSKRSERESTYVTTKNIEKMKISQRRMLANDEGSCRMSDMSFESSFSKAQSLENCKSRRSISRRMLMADLKLCSSENSRDGASQDRSFRRRSTIPGDQCIRSQRNMNRDRSERISDSPLHALDSSRSLAISSPSISTGWLSGTACSRDMAASSTTLGLHMKKSSPKTKNRKRQENIMGKELQKQSSIKW